MTTIRARRQRRALMTIGRGIMLIVVLEVLPWALVFGSVVAVYWFRR